MRKTTIDAMIEFAIESLAGGKREQVQSLIREMARTWPNQPALAAVFAVTSAASSIEEVHDSAAAKGQAASGYKLASLLAADVFAIETMGQIPASCHDLLHYWRRTDPYFLNL